MNKDPSFNSNADPVVAQTNTSDWSILESPSEQPPQKSHLDNLRSKLPHHLGALFAPKTIIESMKDILDAAKVSSVMTSFSENYARAKKKAIDGCDQDMVEYYNVSPFDYDDKTMTLEKTIDIIDEKGISSRIPQEDIQSFGNSLFDAVLHSQVEYGWLKKNKKIGKLSTILRLLEEHGFQPPKNDKTLEYMTDFSDGGGGEIAKTLGLTDEKSIIQGIVSSVNRARDGYATGFRSFTGGDVYQFTRARQNLWDLLDGRIVGELSDAQKAEITKELPINDQGFMAYSERIGGGII